jgi:hypothetical protein
MQSIAWKRAMSTVSQPTAKNYRSHGHALNVPSLAVLEINQVINVKMLVKTVTKGIAMGADQSTPPRNAIK